MRLHNYLLAATLIAAAMTPATITPAVAQSPRWATTWAASVQGPYPVGNPSAQPDQRFAFPSAETGARDQTLRLIVAPSLWGPQIRLRLSNALGTKPVTFDGVFVGLQRSGSVLEPDSNQPVAFGAKPQVTIPPGQSVWSDPVTLPFVGSFPDASMTGGKLAISLHVVGESGPMTWHAKALTTSYVTPPGAGAKGASDGIADFPYSTASWFFLDAIDVAANDDTKVVVTLGDSITDGTASTMNGDDRWPDVLRQRLTAASGTPVSVVNAGIGGNMVVGPADYAEKPFAGGPAALDRLQRDVLTLSGVTSVIWLEGINDISKAGNLPAEPVIEGLKKGVTRLRQAIPGVRVIGATLTTALGSTNPAHGTPEQDVQRKAINAFITTGGVFDSVIDFSTIATDPTTGQMRPEFVPESTTGGPGDKLHPNRAGYSAMGAAIDLTPLRAGPAPAK